MCSILSSAKARPTWVGCCLSTVHDTAAEIDPEIEAGVEEEHHRDDAQNRRCDHPGEAATHELYGRAVGNEAKRTQGLLLQTRCQFRWRSTRGFLLVREPPTAGCCHTTVTCNRGVVAVGGQGVFVADEMSGFGSRRSVRFLEVFQTGGSGCDPRYGWRDI